LNQRLDRLSTQVVSLSFLTVSIQKRYFFTFNSYTTAKEKKASHHETLVTRFFMSSGESSEHAIRSTTQNKMADQVVSTLPLNGIEKYFCVDGGWQTVAHAAHLTGNRSTLITNASNAIQCLLKRHPRMRTRVRVDGNRYFIDNLGYNSENLSSNLFFSTVATANESWQEIVERRCNQDPYSNNGTIVFPTFQFMLLLNSQQSDEQLFHLLLFQNHCVSDGRSGLILINDFLTLATTPNLLEISEPLNTEILPLIGQLIPCPYGFFFGAMSFIGKQLFKRKIRQMTEPRISVKVTPLLTVIQQEITVNGTKSNSYLLRALPISIQDYTHNVVCMK
jgi:hypothetical protein